MDHTRGIVVFLALIVTLSGAAHAQGIEGATPEGITTKEISTEDRSPEKISPEGIPADKISEILEQAGAGAKRDDDATTREPEGQGTGPEPREPSKVEEFMSGKGVDSHVSTDLGQFGYDLFAKPPSTFAPVEQVPVGPGYVLGPGDEVIVAVWGSVEGNWKVTVDRDGNVVLPRVGTFGVAGLTFQELKELLEKEISKLYTGYQMNVSMGALRTIRVYVVGNAQRPGAYTVSSLSTLINALFVAGGPSKTGTMRDIQLKRNGETVAHFDLYGFLLAGDKSHDVRLMPEDVIFIPPAGQFVGVAGSVNRPAIYEIKEAMSVTGIIGMAGGITATGYLQRVQVERVFENEVRIILDVNLKDLQGKDGTVLKDGDIVKVFPISDVIVNAVTLEGNVTRPGRYQWAEGMRVSDILKEPAKDLLPETFMELALIRRLVPPDQHTELVPLNLYRAVFEKDASEDRLLRPGDTLTVYNKWDMLPRENVRIQGSVNRPGAYPYFERMRVSDLVNVSGGLTRPGFPASYLEEGLIVRRRPPDFLEETMTFNFRKAIFGKEREEDVPLRPGDAVMVFDSWEMAEKRRVSITGAVNRPGDYSYFEKMTVRELLNIAGGPKHYAYLEDAELVRTTPTAAGPRVETMNIDLGAAIEGADGHDVRLEPDDHLFVRTVPEWRSRQTVSIQGEVRFPGTYVIRKGEKISSVIERAGGFTEEAYLRGAVFTRESIRKLQQERLDEMVERLERELLGKGVTDASAALSPEEAEITQYKVEQQKELIAKLKETKATGRMAVRLDQPERLRKTAHDVEMEGGDTLSIPRDPKSVQVIGSVYNQAAFVYDGGRGVSGYVDLAGGYTENADREQVYVLRADGTAARVKGKSLSWNQERNRWESGRQELGSGDTIVVPEKLTKVAWLREAKDITQILYQIAVTAGVLIVAF